MIATARSLEIPRMLSHLDPHSAYPNQLRAIHSEGRYCRTTDRRQSDDLGAVLTPGKMVGPRLPVRMKQGSGLPSRGIRCCLTMGFVTVARWTSQAEVFEVCFSTSGTRNDVLKFENRDREVFSGVAISTAIGKMSAYCPLQLNRDVSAHVSGAAVSW